MGWGSGTNVFSVLCLSVWIHSNCYFIRSFGTMEHDKPVYIAMCFYKNMPSHVSQCQFVSTLPIITAVFFNLNDLMAWSFDSGNGGSTDELKKAAQKKNMATILEFHIFALNYYTGRDTEFRTLCPPCFGFDFSR